MKQQVPFASLRLLAAAKCRGKFWGRYGALLTEHPSMREMKIEIELASSSHQVRSIYKKLPWHYSEATTQTMLVK